ncbi:S-adenosyl-L-methionine-dependent methyltransferase [Bombardia bombarda]|uniref:Arsenite methyltransferase n=1 Tax=Bombardia bombarda TaxID=252184 RepID=A0AA39WHU7_9PEZI|nr:S-adenosyl-L-methionine-dependent methyltransferase [Bombardia bombarda]
MDSSDIYDQVSKHYSAASQITSVKYGETVAKSFGYSEEELANIPEGANLGLSCGNPLAITSLREGETVIDLGSGAGFDVFLAATRVSPTGQAIGVDMNDDMLSRANKIKTTRNATNVSFIKGVITDIPLESGIADCIISNCVINLVPDAEKALVFKEIYRLLKPGGRLAVSDILAKKPLPEKLKNDISMYVGCIAGASQLAEYETWLKESGFTDVLISDTNSDLNVYRNTNDDGVVQTGCCPPAVDPVIEKKAVTSCCRPKEVEPVVEKAATSCCGPKKADPVVEKEATSCCGPKKTDSTPAAGTETAAADTDLNEWVGSYKIYAVKN